VSGYRPGGVLAQTQQERDQALADLAAARAALTRVRDLHVWQMGNLGYVLADDLRRALDGGDT
jgi:hypothetical protein